MQRMTLEAAQDLLLRHTPGPAPPETLPLEEALARVCAAPQYASLCIPPFDRSPLDGYALNSASVAGASPALPARLPVARTLFAGDAAGPPLPPGQAVGIMTGAILPEGANCVIRQEDTVLDEGCVVIAKPLAAGENLVRKGEDMQKGQLLVDAGTKLCAAHISLLAGQGYTKAPVYPKPKLAVFSTGSELAPVGAGLPEGMIYDSNSWLLWARAAEQGACVKVRASLPDEPDLLRRELDRLLCEVGFVVTTGGVSVGQKDYLPQVAQKLGGEILFHGLAVKPGGPVLAMAREGGLLLCLSGNPFAALATFEVLAVPILKKLGGESSFYLQRRKATVQQAFAKKSQGRRLVRARLEDGKLYIPQLGHASGMLHSFLGCNCLIDVPAGNAGLSVGDEAEVIVLG